jgi:hypothetical protein
MTNSLAYYKNMQVTDVKSFIVQTPKLLSKICRWQFWLRGVSQNLVNNLQLVNVIFEIIVSNYLYLHSTYLVAIYRGARKLMGENLKLVWAEFSTIS